MKWVQAFIFTGTVAGVALLSACHAAKKFDTAAGLAAAFNVDTVTRDGRQLIRMHSRKAVVFIDPVGARVVEYARHDRMGVFFSPDKVDPERTQVNVRPYNAQPNVLAAGPWGVVMREPTIDFDARRDWMTEANPIFVTLISDTVGGLRWRRRFELYDNGTFVIEAHLTNTRRAPINVAFDSALPVGEQVIDDGDTQHIRVAEQWLSRRLIAKPADHACGFRFDDQTLPGHSEVTWTEQWWITPAKDDGSPPPSAAPPLPEGREATPAS